MPDDSSVVLGPKLGLVEYANIGANFPNSLRAFLRAIDALVQASVLSVTTATPPGSPSDGDAYIVAASPTGAWAGEAGKIAVWSAEIATTDTNTKVPAWEFHSPKAGWLAFNAGDGRFYFYSGTAWAEANVTGNSALPVYANNAAAVTGGLTAGSFYRTGSDPDQVCVVH